MMKLALLLDQDEVCAHWVQPVLKAHNEKYGTNYKREDIKNYWDMEKLNPGGFDFIKAHFDLPGLYANLEPFADAVDSLKQLHELGHELFIVSSVPSGVAFEEKKLWIQKHLPFFPKKNFGSWERKDRVIGDILMDDAPHHLETFSATRRIAAVFDSPWNAHMAAVSVDEFDAERLATTVGLPFSDYRVRVKGWKEFVKLVEKVASVG